MVENGIRSFPAVLQQLCANTDGQPMSNVKLAQAIGVSHSYIAQLRRGTREPTLATVEALAEFLNVHPAYFVGGRRDRAPRSLSQRSFREKLNTLFDLARHPEKNELTLDAAVAAVRERGKERGDTNWTISPSTIIDLRSGKNTNPRLRHVIMLAEVFHSPPAYFLDEELAEQMDSQLRFHRTMAELGIEKVVTRAPELTEEVRDSLVRTLVKALKPEAADAVEEALTRSARAPETPDGQPSGGTAHGGVT
ncbi:helix-turn-helix transcriptional regulator [Crossiella sp. CA-258035]|uniref:helix-turn-helix domain-containing protein n=1 Tax=Crossiella sp. CA-258035 TaxID=2981138 RepID=UPI0024BD5871|nr:helix-turn-helix transcriptional regulator [Crossiella sp. CA-258035]WHT20223.1 helix-turn-helix transcriptional regulator [Crossiella sp. CA-258035]